MTPPLSNPFLSSVFLILLGLSNQFAQGNELKLSNYIDDAEFCDLDQQQHVDGFSVWLETGNASNWLVQDVEIRSGSKNRTVTVQGRKRIRSKAPIIMEKGSISIGPKLKKRFRSDVKPDFGWGDETRIGDTVVTAPDTTGINVGDYAVLECDARWETQWKYGANECWEITRMGGTDLSPPSRGGDTFTVDYPARFSISASQKFLEMDFYTPITLEWRGLDLRGTRGRGTLRIGASRNCRFSDMKVTLPGDDALSVDGIRFSHARGCILDGVIVDGGRYGITFGNGRGNEVRNLTCGGGELSRHPVDLVTAEHGMRFVNWQLLGNVSSPAPAHPCYEPVCIGIKGKTIGFSPRSMGLTMKDCDITVTGTGTNYWQSLNPVEGVASDEGKAAYASHPFTMEGVRIHYAARNFAISPNKEQNATFTNCRLSGVGQGYRVNPDTTLTLESCVIGFVKGYGGVTARNTTFDVTIPEVFDAASLNAVIDGNGGNAGAIVLTDCIVRGNGELPLHRFVHDVYRAARVRYVHGPISANNWSGAEKDYSSVDPTFESVTWPFTSRVQYQSRYEKPSNSGFPVLIRTKAP